MSSCASALPASSHMSSQTRRAGTRNMPAVNIYRPPAARLAREGQEAASDTDTSTTKPSARQRRPDIQVYVPRPRRFASENSPQNPPSPDVTPSPPKASRHRNSSPNVVTPRKKSHKPSVKPEPFTLATSNRTPSCDSDISNCDLNLEEDIQNPSINENHKENLSSIHKNEQKNKRNSTELNITNISDKINKPVLYNQENNTSCDQENLLKYLHFDKQKVDSVTNLEQSNLTMPSSQIIVEPHLDTTPFTDDRLTMCINNFTPQYYQPEVNLTSLPSLQPQTFESDFTQTYQPVEIKPSETPVRQVVPATIEFGVEKDELGKFLSREKKLIKLKDKQPSLENSQVLCIKEIEPLAIKSVRKKVPTTSVVELDELGKALSLEKKRLSKLDKSKVQSSPTDWYDDCVANEMMPKSSSKKADSKKSSPASQLSTDDCTWDMLFDEDGDCLDPSLMEELTRAVGKVRVERPSSDYSAYESAREAVLAERDYSHVLEVYGFPAEFKTQDLMTILLPMAGRAGCELKWVDDTHALSVFSNSHIAAEVLAHGHPMLKLRPLSQASAESRQKARRSTDFLQPYRPRPETCPAMAKRLVSSALGVRLNTSREEREKERTLLREAREKKRLAAKQSEEAWEGTIGGK